MPLYCPFSVDVESIQTKIRHSWFKILSRRSSPALHSHLVFQAKIVQKYKKKVNIISLYLYLLASTIWTSLIRFYHCNIGRKMILTQICRQMLGMLQLI